jgi:hypothetical protein
MPRLDIQKTHQKVVMERDAAQQAVAKSLVCTVMVIVWGRERTALKHLCLKIVVFTRCFSFSMLE